MRLMIAILLIYPLGLSARGIDSIVSSLAEAACYQATARYSVLMSLQDDVAYTVALRQASAPADSLCPCSYLVEWTADTPGRQADETAASGFAAYFDGHAYSFRGERLAEYHFDKEPSQFLTYGADTRSPIPGIQWRAQFAQLLPAMIAADIKAMMHSPQYTCRFTADTIIDSRKCDAFSAVWAIDGDVMREALYTFDPSTGMPLYSRMENNPGRLAEQTVEARYTYTTDAPCEPITSESQLRQLYPDQFLNFRESTYAITSLKGRRLPSFAIPTTTGERYTYHAGDGFPSPTVIVMLDAAQAFTPKVIEAVRTSVQSMPRNVDVIWAFGDNNTDTIEPLIPGIRVGEHLLMSAKSLIRDCGASALPAILTVDTAGTVTGIIQGFNNNLAADVIQTLAEI